MAVEYTESIENVLKDILPQLPGVIRSVAARECRLAMREFFEKSHAWVETVESVAIPTGDTAIQVDDGDTNTEVIAIHEVRIGNATDGYQIVHPLGRVPDKIEGTNSKPWGWYVTSNPDEFKLHPYNESATSDDLRVRVALIPAFDTDVNSTDLPRQITLRYYDAILDGTLARLYMHPNKPYSQPVLGTQLRHKFLKAIGYYAGQRKKGYNNSQMWRFPSGWTTRLRQRYG
jgi:hypothetical protein